MLGLAWIVVSVLAALLLMQALPTLLFIRMLRRWQPARLPDQQCPKAAVVLCLRGDDPFLPDCLQGLLNQDYPDYEVKIVVDHMDDPAWQVAQQAIDQCGATHAQVEALRERLDSCSLKGSSIVQAVSQLDESYQIVAFLDADTIPHKTWLRELAAPLVADPQVGVASGNRWYMPDNPTLASLIRYIWNAGGVLQTYWNQFPWGGSLALRRSIACHPNLIQRWKRAVSTDAVIIDVVRQEGLRTAFVPSILMVNRESCQLGNFFNWIQRQLVVGRLYHRGGWIPILLHGLVTAMLPLLAILVFGWAISQGHSQVAMWTAAAVAFYALGMAALLGLLERAVRRIVSLRSEPTNWFTPLAFIKGLLALPLAQYVHTAGLVRAAFMRRVRWRGISYQLAGNQVHMVEYHPYQSAPETRDSIASL